MNNKEQLKVQIDLKKDTQPVYSEDGNMIFQEAVIFRKASKFLTGQQQDSMIPITVFIDVKTGKPVKELLPKELWSDFGYSEIVTPEPLTNAPRTVTEPVMKVNKD